MFRCIKPMIIAKIKIFSGCANAFISGITVGNAKLGSPIINLGMKSPINPPVSRPNSTVHNPICTRITPKDLYVLFTLPIPLYSKNPTIANMIP